MMPVSYSGHPAAAGGRFVRKDGVEAGERADNKVKFKQIRALW